MNCRFFQKEVEEADLDALLTWEASEHIQICASCRLLRDEQLSLRRLIAGLETTSVPANFEFRLRARLATSKVERHRSISRLSFTPSALSILLAACFALTVSIAHFIKEIESTDTSNHPSAEVARRSPLQAPQFSAHQASNYTLLSDVEESRGEVDTVRVKRFSKRNIKATNSFSRSVVAALHTTSFSRQAAESQPGIHGTSNNFSVRGAPVISLHTANSIAETNATVAVAVDASAPSFEVVLRDAQGNARTVTMKNVTFGAQDFVDQLSSTNSASATEAVW